MNDRTIFVATQSQLTQFEGRPLFIHQGVTTVRAGHPLLTTFAHVFVPLRPTFEVEADPDAEPETETVSPAEPAQQPPAPADPATSAPAPKDVRAWAAEQGIEVSAKGKLPDALVEQYQAAQQEA